MYGQIFDITIIIETSRHIPNSKYTNFNDHILTIDIKK
jgi:hypothetical protein